MLCSSALPEICGGRYLSAGTPAPYPDGCRIALRLIAQFTAWRTSSSLKVGRAVFIARYETTAAGVTKNRCGPPAVPSGPYCAFSCAFWAGTIASLM